MSVVKPEWGTKRACPKCNTRFYDLGKDDPVTCIECGNVWTAEPYLKSKQPLPFEAAAKPKPEGEEAEVLADEDLDIEDEEAPADSDDDLDGDDDIAAVVPGETDEEV